MGRDARDAWDGGIGAKGKGLRHFSPDAARRSPITLVINKLIMTLF
jgi:hypothetical protein